METSSESTHFSEGFTQSGHPKTHFPCQADDKPFACKYCSKTFSTVCNLKKHFRPHTGEKPFACTYCTKRFCESGSLKTHIRTHTGRKPSECKSCSKTFSTAIYLKTHFRTHTGEKPFACAYCSKKFSHSTNLKTHSRTHTGEKPFACTYCTKRFCDSGGLKTHIRTHTGEKPFPCTYCTKRFCELGSLNTHIRTHTGEKPFVCTYCTKRFCQSESLKRHIRTHTGEKPFACTHCSKTFSHSYNLKTHFRTHTGEKPFTCTHCNKTFTQLSHLKTHLHRFHDTGTDINNCLRSSEVDCPDMKTDTQCEDQVLVFPENKNGSAPVGNVLSVAALNCKEEIIDETDCKPTVANGNQTTNDVNMGRDVTISCGESCEVKVKVEPLCDIQIESVRSISLAMFSHANEEIDYQVKSQSMIDLKREVKTELTERRQQEYDDVTVNVLKSKQLLFFILKKFVKKFGQFAVICEYVEMSSMSGSSSIQQLFRSSV